MKFLSNLVQGLWRNGFGVTDGQKDGRTYEAPTICSPFGEYKKLQQSMYSLHHVFECLLFQGHLNLYHRIPTFNDLKEEGFEKEKHCGEKGVIAGNHHCNYN